MCDCSACRTGKCGCPQCSEGPGIDFRADHALVESIRQEIAIERIRIRDLRAPSIERQQVRRWGEITPSTSMFNQDQERGDHVRKEEDGDGPGADG